MRGGAVVPVLILALVGLSDAAPAPQTRLSFAQRVEAQEAIERVYHAHQVGATLPFDRSVPRALLEEKVRTYLKRTLALERFWNTKVTGAMLAAEAERMARGSRMPGRLAELHAALGDDPLLILECLVRPALVERLIRGAFASDAPRAPTVRFDAWWLSVADALDEELVGPIDAVPAELLRRAFEPQAAHPSPPGDPAGFYPGCVPADAWVASSLDSEARAGHTAVWTGSVMIVWGGQSGSKPIGTGFRYNPATDVYTPIATLNAPSPRHGHTAVYSTGRMIVWGGMTDGAVTNTGAIYRPLTDTWQMPTSLVDAPSPRWGHTSVWAGIEMIVWGGTSGSALDTGAMYNPVSNSWTPVAATDAPAARTGHSAVWTGSDMILWGGSGAGGALDDGAHYTPHGAWNPLPSLGAPEARWAHSAVWTEEVMIVWGGMTDAGETDTGAAYNPSTHSWSPLSGIDAPTARSGHTVVWDGISMLIWGGGAVAPADTGALYDPAADSWTPMAVLDAPVPRLGHTAVWAGTRMIVWGGTDLSGELGSGGRYEPSLDTWSPTAETGPSPRQDPATVWTGNEMIVWGGTDFSFVYFRDGAKYNPAIDAWSAVSTTGAPTASPPGAVAWTGAEMVMKDARYNPVADTWSPVSAINAPSLFYYDARAIWTGSVVVFWDGRTGGRYNPATDTWRPVSTVGAPPIVSEPSVVWTGSSMITWGGNIFPLQADTGGRYDPLADTWLPVSTQNAPGARFGHQALWSGEKMFIWGGAIRDADGIRNALGGGLYDPVTDVWQPVTGGHWHGIDTSAVWTGSRFLVWGGRAAGLFVFDEGYLWESVYVNSGGLYDPVADAWTTTTTAGAPEPRAGHAAVWTGSSMLVWGGFNCDRPTQTCWTLGSGGVYGFDPSADADGDGFGINCDCDDSTITVHPGAPQICGDGVNNDCLDPAWPSAMGTNEADEDGDDFEECDGDCDDTLAAVRPGGAQVCDGVNNDCGDPLWPALPVGDTDEDGDGFPVCPGGPVDCNDADSAVWAPPSEAPVTIDLGFIPGIPWPVYPTNLSWDRPAAPGAVNVRYDVLRSSTASNFTGSALCARTDVPWGGDVGTQQPTEPSEIHYYLIRSENDCPGQSVGYSSDGAPRAARSCP